MARVQTKPLDCGLRRNDDPDATDNQSDRQGSLQNAGLAVELLGARMEGNARAEHRVLQGDELALGVTGRQCL